MVGFRPLYNLIVILAICKSDLKESYVLFVFLGNRPHTMCQNTSFLKAASGSYLKHVHFAKQSVMSSVDEWAAMCHSPSTVQSAVITGSGRVSQSLEVHLLETYWCLQLLTSVVHPSFNLKRSFYDHIITLRIIFPGHSLLYYYVVLMRFIIFLDLQGHAASDHPV